MPIGLKRGYVELVPHDPLWSVEFEREVEKLKAILPDYVYPYEHIGSTAIPNIPAKPIIDFIGGVANMQEAYDLKSLLEENGYQHRSNGDNEERVLFVRGREECRTHHFSLVVRSSLQWFNAVGFRDVLRSNPDLSLEYAQLKRELAINFPQQRSLYTQGKVPFFKEVFGSIPK